jgi:hypothetical protein
MPAYSDSRSSLLYVNPDPAHIAFEARSPGPEPHFEGPVCGSRTISISLRSRRNVRNNSPRAGTPPQTTFVHPQSSVHVVHLDYVLLGVAVNVHVLGDTSERAEHDVRVHGMWTDKRAATGLGPVSSIERRALRTGFSGKRGHSGTFGVGHSLRTALAEIENLAMKLFRTPVE